MHQRNAERVFPEPVGATMSVLFPAAIEGHPSLWGGLGSPNVFENHERTMGWNADNASEFFIP